MTDTRIDIAVNENGIDNTVRGVNQVAAAAQKLSPRVAAALRGAALRLGINTDKLVKQVAVTVLDKVVHTTPHDTGRARGNWQVKINVGSPATNPMPENFDYEGDETVAKGTAIINGTQRKPGQTIFISNALPYIDLLDHGSSTQAPFGMVAQAVQAARQTVSNARLFK